MWLLRYLIQLPKQVALVIHWLHRLTHSPMMCIKGYWSIGLDKGPAKARLYRYSQTRGVGMMYVVKIGDNPDNWIFFNTHESATRWLQSYRAYDLRPELNLTPPYCY